MPGERIEGPENAKPSHGSFPLKKRVVIKLTQETIFGNTCLSPLPVPAMEIVMREKLPRLTLATIISLTMCSGWVLAAHGPCIEAVPGGFTNTLRCVMVSNDPPAADCVGNVVIQVQQKVCQNSDESPCAETPRELLIIYTGTPCVYVWWASWPSAGIYSFSGCEQDWTSAIALGQGTGC